MNLYKNIEWLQKKGWVEKVDSTLFNNLMFKYKNNLSIDETTEFKARKIICKKYLDKIIDYDVERKWVDIPLLKTELKQHQKRDVRMIEKFKGRCLIGEGMGSGKTLTSITFALKHNLLPLLVICPASIKYNWKNEFEKHTHFKGKIVVIDGEKWNKGITEEDIESAVFIINYDLVDKWQKFLTSIEWSCCVLDEIHKIKSYKSKRTQIVRKITKPIPYILTLSGTPIPNRVIELFTTLNIVRPDLYPNPFKFGYTYHQDYCPPELWATNRARTKDLDKLYVNLKETLLVRSDIKLDIPDKNRIFVPFDVKLGDNYERAREEYIALHNISNRKLKNIEEDIVRLYGFMKGIAVQARKKQSYAWIKDKAEECDKLVIFCWYHEVVEELKALFKPEEVIIISGEVDSKKRQKEIDAFQTNPNIKICIGTIGACAEGITLTAAHNLVFMETTYVPALIQQAEARICRISQTKEQNIYYLVSKNTVEEDIMGMLDNKQITIGLALDGTYTQDEELWGKNIK